MAAFANSRGGVFVFGVDDRTRDVVGIPAGSEALYPWFWRDGEFAGDCVNDLLTAREKQGAREHAGDVARNR